MCHKTEGDLKHLTTDLFANLALSLPCVFYKELFFIKSFIMYSVKRCMCLWICCLVCLYCWFIYLCYFSNFRQITSGNNRVNSSWRVLDVVFILFSACIRCVRNLFPFQFGKDFLVVYACKHKKMFPSFISEKKKKDVCLL